MKNPLFLHIDKWQIEGKAFCLTLLSNISIFCLKRTFFAWRLSAILSSHLQSAELKLRNGFVTSTVVCGDQAIKS